MKESARRSKKAQKYTLFRGENQGRSAVDGGGFIGSFSIFTYFLLTTIKFSPVRGLLIYVFTLIFGFFVGSIPTTYLLVKWRRKLDIRKEGTGNVGTMNVYEVTNSRALGIVVLAIDLLKAVAAVLLAGTIFGGDFWTMSVAGLGAVLGHNYSPWLGFKGGRGLATTLGISLVLGWVIAAVWMLAFAAVYAVRRDIHIGNIAASIVMPVALAVLPGDTMSALVPGAAPGDIVVLSVCMAILILLGHIRIISQFFKQSVNQ